MYRFLKIVSIFFVVQLTTAEEFPSKLERCHAGDTVCLARVIEWYMHALKDGNKDLGIVPLDPMYFKYLKFLEVQDNDSPVNINIQLKECSLYGFSTAKITKVVGFGKDPSKSRFEIHGKIDKISFVSQYKVRGHIIIMPVIGSGPMNLTLNNVNFFVKFYPRVEIKEGKEYLQFREVKFDFKTKRFHMDYLDQFNRATNRFFNQNWPFILDELRPVIGKTYGEVFGKITSRLFAKFPYKDLFL